MDPLTDLTFWQLVLLVIVALPVLAIVLVAAVITIGFVLWWTIKIAFFGAVLLIIVMTMVTLARLFGVV